MRARSNWLWRSTAQYAEASGQGISKVSTAVIRSGNAATHAAEKINQLQGSLITARFSGVFHLGDPDGLRSGKN
jgi:hypothetical protein